MFNVQQSKESVRVRYVGHAKGECEYHRKEVNAGQSP